LRNLLHPPLRAIAYRLATGVELRATMDDRAIGEPTPHVPVLLDEVLAALAPLAGARILDGTFGAGGYSTALLEAGAHVIAIDRDPDVRRFAEPLAQRHPDQFRFVSGTFSRLDELAGGPVDGVVLDIGVSSMQLDEAARGFSFSREGPLDMRMSGEGTSAADLVNGLGEPELADLLYLLGEERKSRRIAHGIVVARAAAPITTTTALARLIEKAIGRRPGDIHPATRSFQALRIAVNGELDELVEGLFASERLLAEGGRLAVVSFHSLEDRIVKRFFSPEKTASASRHLPAVEAAAPRWTDVVRPVRAGRAETEANPRARSAPLRTARRTAAAPRPVSYEGLGVPQLRGAA
jgi:16S rRNA (cytosine1402-N4)-methyltransferase